MAGRAAGRSSWSPQGVEERKEEGLLWRVASGLSNSGDTGGEEGKESENQFSRPGNAITEFCLLTFHIYSSIFHKGASVPSHVHL